MMDERLLEDVIADYLEGELSTREARELERRFAEPEAARLLAEALAFRDMMRTLPPEHEPEDLNARIAVALGVEGDATVLPGEPAEERKGARGGSWLSSVAGALGWSLRATAGGAAAGAVAATPGRPSSLTGFGGALDGMSTARYALGPLQPTPSLRKPLGRRLGARVGGSLWGRLTGQAKGQGKGRKG